MKMSLKTKLIMGGIIASALPLIIVGYLSISKASSALVAEAQFKCVQMTKDLAMLTEGILKKDASFAMGISRIPALNRAVQKVYNSGAESAGEELNELQQMLTAVHESVRDSYHNIFVLDKDGNILADSIGLKDKFGSLGDREYFKEAKKGKTYFSAPFISTATGGQRIVIMTLPLENSSGNFAGALAMPIDLERLSQTIAKVKLGETGIPFMISRTGLTIAHPDPQKILKSNPAQIKETQTFANRMIAQESGVEFYEFGGQKRIVGFALLNSRAGASASPRQNPNSWRLSGPSET